MIADATRLRTNIGRLASWSLVAALLLFPAIAMLFTDEVAWTASDFAFAALLLVGGGLLIELALWKARSVAALIALSLAVVAMVALIWAEGAVGLFH